MKNTSENPDSTINSLTHYEETVNDKALQAITPSGHNGRGQVKAQTELAYAVSQALCILDMCQIHISRKFTFNLEV